MIDQQRIAERVRELGPWFHNLDLRGVRTAPDHFLGDYPTFKWQRFAHAVPQDLSGRTVLDIGCNAGFYSMEMKRRGAARVVGIDSDERYLEQARFASEVEQLEIEYRRGSVYDVASLGETFDVVIFMGVLYHLRHPLLALDLLHEYAVKDVLIFQSMLRGSDRIENFPSNAPFSETAMFARESYPKMFFIEHEYANDPTNWWIPNKAGAQAMLRSAGFAIETEAEDEVFICRRTRRPEGRGSREDYVP